MPVCVGFGSLFLLLLPIFHLLFCGNSNFCFGYDIPFWLWFAVFVKEVGDVTGFVEKVNLLSFFQMLYRYYGLVKNKVISKEIIY
jgi:hypothetical protein